MESILNSIKKKLGMTENYVHFDDDVIMCINSAFMVLTQLGIGPANGFSITSDFEKWNQFLEDGVNLESVKSYVYFKCRLEFDPPTQTSLLESMERQARELEWRLQVQADLNN